jgi:hypothetical protein
MKLATGQLLAKQASFSGCPWQVFFNPSQKSGIILSPKHNLAKQALGIFYPKSKLKY